MADEPKTKTAKKPASRASSRVDFGTSYPQLGASQPPPLLDRNGGRPSGASWQIPQPWQGGGGMMQPTPPSPIPGQVPQLLRPPAPPPAAPAPPAVPGAAGIPGAPDFLQEFLRNILGPALQAQNANTAAGNQFRNDATFGRHLGIDGRPQGEGMSFDQLSVPMDQRIAKERATFGGQSFTAGDRAPLSGSAWMNQQPMPEKFSTNPMAPQIPSQAAWGSPVYQAQHPEFNMFQQQAYSNTPMQRRMF